MLKILPSENYSPPTELKRGFCSLPYTKLILSASGYVSMCCHQSKQIGKLDEHTSVMDLWNSTLANEIRQSTADGVLHPVCKSWNSCPFLTRAMIPTDNEVGVGLKYPLYLELCLPDKHCNVGGEKPSAENPACIMCKRNFELPAQTDITDFLCEKAKPIMRYLKTFCVLGIAEPFWKEAVFRIFEKVDFAKHRNHITFYTNTNGICLTERVAQKFFDEVTTSELSWSLDAASAPTHQKIRRLDTFDLVVKNLRRWNEMRQKYPGKHKTYVYNNINLLNVHEMTDMVKLSIDLGVDHMIMLPTYEQNAESSLGELVLCAKNLDLFKKESEKAMDHAVKSGFKLIYQNRFDVVPPKMELDQIAPNLVQLRIPKPVVNTLDTKVKQ